MHRLFFIVLILFSILPTTHAKDRKKNKLKDDTSVVAVMKDTIPTKKDTTKAEKKDDTKTIKDFTKKCHKITGLFNLYQDTTSGKLYLEVTQDKLEKEFIYFAHDINGIIDAGYAKGGYRENDIFKIQKYFDRLDFSLQNIDYYFDPQNAISKAQKSNINQPLFLSEKIVAKDENAYLIDADNLFFTESIKQIKPSKSPNAKPDDFTLGTLSKSKSKYIKIKNFPSNTDVAVSYIFENPSPTNYGGTEVTDARFVAIDIQHSFIEMPINNYQPRYDDPRVGFFMNKVNDQTSTSPTPYRDIIHRWDLQKKDPTASISEPITPIVWWIENTTPIEFRETIKNAALTWNIAFEKAGFKNAIEVYIQPDSANWDAEDIRYNVLRWTSSPRPPFGGYGPHFVNPRSGQILGADIMLEYIFLTNRVLYEKLFDVAALDNQATEEGMQHENAYACNYNKHLQQNVQTGLHVMTANNFSDFEKREFLKQALYDLVIHELGHTFGLNHNFIASCLHSNEEVQNVELGSTVGLTASVMDYTIPNISPDKKNQGLYFDIKPGPYDEWAIQYGYSSYNNKEDEKKGLHDILSESTKPEHLFFNDGDDMRSVGKGIDPRVMLFDMSNDPISYATKNTILLKNTIKSLLDKYTKEDQSFHALRNAFIVLTGNINRNLNIISRYIGGVYIDRSFSNQNTPNKPYTPVDIKTQKNAMSMLKKLCFAPNAFNINPSIYNYLQPQRRGYNRDGNEDPRLHDRFLNIQKSVLDQLLHKEVLQRIVDTKLYGNQYDINKVLEDLSNAIFIEDLYTNTNTIRQNLQGEYVNRLLDIINVKSSYSFSVKAAVFAQIDKIKNWLSTTNAGDANTKGHRKNLLYIINSTIEEK
jgi:hypothetical protein